MITLKHYLQGCLCKPKAKKISFLFKLVFFREFFSLLSSVFSNPFPFSPLLLLLLLLVSAPLGWPAMLLVLPRLLLLLLLLLQRRPIVPDHVRRSTRHKLVLQRLHKVHVGLLLLLLVWTIAISTKPTASAGVVRVLHGQRLEVILQVQIVHKVPRRWSHPLLGTTGAAAHGQVLVHHPVGGAGSGRGCCCRRCQGTRVVVHGADSSAGTVVKLPAGTFGTDRTGNLAAVVLPGWSPRATVRRGLVVVVWRDGWRPAEGHRESILDVHERISRLEVGQVGEPVAATSTATIAARRRSMTMRLLVASPIGWHSGAASVRWKVLVLSDRSGRRILVEHVTELVRRGQLASGRRGLMVLRGWNRRKGRRFRVQPRNVRQIASRGQSHVALVGRL